MSSEVQAKWMNSSALLASAFFASFERSQYSIALTSWLVSASMFLICSASRSEKLFYQAWRKPSGSRPKTA